MANQSPATDEELRSAFRSFTKNDSDKKSRPELIPVEFRTGMARVLAGGAVMHGDDNWRNCDNPKVFIGALMRHMESYEAGDTIDPDTGEHTLLHAACCIMILHGLDVQRKAQEADNSPEARIKIGLRELRTSMYDKPNPGGLF